MSTPAGRRIKAVSSLCVSQRRILRSGDGTGEGHGEDGRHQVHPQKGAEGEGDEHRERNRRAQEVGAQLKREGRERVTSLRCPLGKLLRLPARTNDSALLI